MSLLGKAFSQAALCTAEIEEDNTISLSQSNIETSAIGGPGSSIRVRLFNRSPEDTVKPLDSDTFNGQLLPGNKVLIDPGVMSNLDLEEGDIVSYLIIGADTLPGLFDGPLRATVQGDDNEVSKEERRGERDATQATYTATMRQTGQVNIPADVRESLALLPGDDIHVVVEYEGSELSYDSNVQTKGRRFGINKEQRQQLGLEEVKNEKPEVTVNISVL